MRVFSFVRVEKSGLKSGVRRLERYNKTASNQPNRQFHQTHDANTAVNEYQMRQPMPRPDRTQLKCQTGSTPKWSAIPLTQLKPLNASLRLGAHDAM
jgi:hypothetical protein